MFQKSISFLLLFLVGVFLFFPFQAVALQISDYPSFFNIRAGMSLTEIVSTIFNFLLMIAGLAAFIMVVWGGVKYLSSVGDPSKMDDSKNQIFSAILGLIIIFASWMILNTINPQLVELKEPGVPDAPQAGDINAPRVTGECLEGENYLIELYPKANYQPGDNPSKCYLAGENEKNFSEKVYSIKINGSTSIKLFDEPNFSGKNICFRGSVANLHSCILSGNNDCVWGYAGWEKPKSIKIGGACANPGTTLSSSGSLIGEKCLPWAEEVTIPTCIYQ